MSEQDATLDEFTDKQNVIPESSIKSSLDETAVGGIPSDWKITRLGDIAVEREYGLSESAEEYDPEKPRYIRTQDFDDFGGLKQDSLASLSWEKAGGELLEKGDMLFARSGSVGASLGKVYLYDPKHGACCYGGYSIRHRLQNEGINHRYITQFTLSDRYWDWIRRRAKTTAQSNINTGEYGSLPIPIPPVEEQRKIASVLHTVDQAIQKTEEIQSQLQHAKKGLVQDFLTEGPGDSKVSETGTKLGTLPEHWGVVTIENTIADEENAFTDGARYSLSSDEIHSQGEARAILLEEVGDGEFDDSGPKFATQEKYEEITHRAIYPGEVVVAKMAEPVARACIVPETYDKYLLGCADVVRIVPDSQIEDRFLMYCMNSHKIWRQAVAHLRGTGRSRINLENIAELEIPKPPIEEQKQIVEVLSEFDKKIKTERQHKSHLQRLKKGLIQDLLSGEVRTHDKDIEIIDDVLQYG